MTNEIAIDWHERNLAEFSMTANGNRNVQLNTLALKSFNLALGCDYLSPDKVESDYISAAKTLQMDDSSVKATLRSASNAATPHEFYDNGSNSVRQENVDKSNLIVAPTYTALEDYAIAHGAPVSAFERGKWTEGEHNNRKCLRVPHEDGVVRVRFLDGETPKWIPIKTGDKKITPCWYGFNGAVAMASKAAHKTIVLCNGQPSVVAAQHYGIPALAQTDGENKKITPPLIKRFLAAIKEHKLKVMVVFDGDNTGREATKKILDQLQDNKIEVSIVSFGGNDGFDLADYCKIHTNKTFDSLCELARFSKHESKPITTGREMARSFEETLLNPIKSLPAGEMIIVPTTQLHEKGGFAKMLQPGMLTEIMGPSGGGKTSFMETWLDILRKWGYESLWYSPEWIPEAMHLRTIQRWGGAPSDVIWDALMWYSEEKKGVPESQRKGKPLVKTDAIWKRSLAVNRSIMGWPGDIHCFEGSAVTEDILETMAARLYEMRRYGIQVGLAFFDYAQLLRTGQEAQGKNSYELIISNIKDWCRENSIHGVVGSQVTKEKARECINQKRLLGKYDSHWVAPNEFNLILSLNIQYDGEDPVTKEPIKTPYGIVNVCKNSYGQEGAVKMMTNFKHLCWEDKGWDQS